MQISPQYIDQPKQGRTNWSVKDAQGNYYSCPPELVGRLAVGVVAEIQTNSKVYNGKTTVFISEIHGAGGNPGHGTPSPQTTPEQAHAPQIDPRRADIWMQSVMRLAGDLGVDPVPALIWAKNNFEHYISRKPEAMTPFPTTKHDLGAPPFQEMVDPPEKLDDEIPF